MLEYIAGLATGLVLLYPLIIYLGKRQERAKNEKVRSNLG